jgi:hypothetical protein
LRQKPFAYQAKLLGRLAACAGGGWVKLGADYAAVNGEKPYGGWALVSCNRDIIARLRERIPSFACVPGCHDCCGPVTTSSEEMSRLPVKTDAEHDAALNELNCVHLGPNGCEVYAERPLICRLFGTTPRMPCPNGRRPEDMIEPQIERQIHHYIATTRQVLV